MPILDAEAGGRKLEGAIDVAVRRSDVQPSR